VAGNASKSGTAFMRTYSPKWRSRMWKSIIIPALPPADASAKMSELKAKSSKTAISRCIWARNPRADRKEADAMLEEAWADVGGRK
jgi:hypothetical protein